MEKVDDAEEPSAESLAEIPEIRDWSRAFRWQPRHAFVAWLAAHGDAWATGDYAAYQHSVAAVVMLPDDINVEVRS